MYPVTYKYRKNYRYYPNHEGVFPVVEMNIQANGRAIDLPVIIDTGAQNTLLSPDYARALGLDLPTGKVKHFTQASGGSFRAYGHIVRIGIMEEVFDVEVYFPELTLHRCLLGRDIMEKMQVGLKESLSTLFMF